MSFGKKTHDSVFIGHMRKDALETVTIIHRCKLKFFKKDSLVNESKCSVIYLVVHI